MDNNQIYGIWTDDDLDCDVSFIPLKGANETVESSIPQILAIGSVEPSLIQNTYGRCKLQILKLGFALSYLQVDVLAENETVLNLKVLGPNSLSCPISIFEHYHFEFRTVWPVPLTTSSA